MIRFPHIAVGLSLLLAGLCQSAAAEGIDYTHITIVDNAAPFNASFEASNIVTNYNTWVSTDPPGQNTDGFGYASASRGADTFVDFQFDQPYTFSNIRFIDRLHSGAGTTAPGGTLDYVTEANFILSQNPTYGDADDVTFTAGPYAVPSPRTHPDDFIHDVAIPNVTAQYIRYDVVSTVGSNPGAHTFIFIPEPSTCVSGLICFVVAGLFRRRRS